MTQVIYIIGIPIAIGLLLLLLPERIKTLKGIINLVVNILTLYLGFRIFTGDAFILKLGDLLNIKSSPSSMGDLLPYAERYMTFTIDNLSKLIILFISIFGFLISLYSLRYITRSKKIFNYHSYYLITLGASFGAVCSNNLILFLIFWGILALTLYKLIRGSDEVSSAAAKKSLVIIGASDGIMIIGVAILWKITGTLNMSEISLSTNNALATTAFFALLIGSFTKAGAFPFHTWIPDFAKSAPASSSALLPASLDKLLGIYFLARITTNLFTLNDGIRVIILSIGVITIITAVMMALVQHNYKRLLGYHAVSQVGYMVLGFGLGSPLGIAAGMFHMINHALYKSGLFLAAGCVEKQTGKEDISELGGLSRSMPVTFITTLVFALSISGIPPFNGFASKWMIYQGIIDFGQGEGIANQLWILWLGLAILGSAMTLASFIKLIGGIFLGPSGQESRKVREAPVLMWLPTAILTLICILFGVLATNVVVPYLFMDITGEFDYPGIWNSSGVAILIVVSIILGILIYLAGNIKNFRTSDSFIGGEKMQDQTSFSTLEFYKTFSEFRWLNWVYRKAEERWFDLYDLLKKFNLWISKLLSRAHTGLLQDYAIWVFVGLIILLIILL